MSWGQVGSHHVSPLAECWATGRMVKHIALCRAQEARRQRRKPHFVAMKQLAVLSRETNNSLPTLAAWPALDRSDAPPSGASGISIAQLRAPRPATGVLPARLLAQAKWSSTSLLPATTAVAAVRHLMQESQTA